MKLRDLRIENYDWHVRFYFAVHGYHTRSILFSLEQIECPRPIMERVRENLEKADMDSGFTYSNKTRRRSVVVVGLASSQAQFLNSFEHELRHLCDDIAVASAMPMQGEEVAYLTGQINTMLWKDIHQFICCIGNSHRQFRDGHFIYTETDGIYRAGNSRDAVPKQDGDLLRREQQWRQVFRAQC